MAIIDSLEVALGFKSDMTTLNKFIKGLGELNFNAVLSSLGLEKMVTGLDNLTQSAINSLSPFNRLAAITGGNASQFQAFANAGKDFNVSAEEMIGLLANINKASRDMFTGAGYGPQLAGLLHVNLTQYLGKPQDALVALGKATNNLIALRGRGVASALLDQIGAPTDQLLLLSDNVDKLELGIRNANKTFAETNQLMKSAADLASAWQATINSLAASLGGPLIAVMDTFKNILLFINDQLENNPFASWTAGLVTLVGTIVGGFGALNILSKILGLIFGGGIIGAGAKALLGVGGAIAGETAAAGIAGGAGLAAAAVPGISLPLLLGSIATSGILGFIASRAGSENKPATINQTFNINGGDKQETYHIVEEATRNALKDSDAFARNGSISY